jgi:hypothetical protein
VRQVNDFIAVCFFAVLRQELMDAQKAACQQAGPRKGCIVSSLTSGLGQDPASGEMQMKAAADRIASFPSSLTPSCKGEYSAVSESIWRPLGEACKAFVPNIVGSLASIVQAVSSLLIWIVLLAGVAVLLGKPWRGRRKGAATGTACPPGPKTD